MRRARPHGAALAGRLAGIVLLLCLALAWTTAAQAQVRAWLDRDRIALDETTELSIEIDGMTADASADGPVAPAGHAILVIPQPDQGTGTVAVEADRM